MRFCRFAGLVAVRQHASSNAHVDAKIVTMLKPVRTVISTNNRAASRGHWSARGTSSPVFLLDFIRAFVETLDLEVGWVVFGENLAKEQNCIDGAEVAGRPG